MIQDDTILNLFVLHELACIYAEIQKAKACNQTSFLYTMTVNNKCAEQSRDIIAGVLDMLTTIGYNFVTNKSDDPTNQSVVLTIYL